MTKREVILSPEITSHEDDFMNDNFGRPTLHQANAALFAANPGLSYDEVLNDDFQFDMNAHDVMVFLHIQKTGGTSFGKHLVRDLDLKVSGTPLSHTNRPVNHSNENEQKSSCESQQNQNCDVACDSA